MNRKKEELSYSQGDSSWLFACFCVLFVMLAPAAAAADDHHLGVDTLLNEASQILPAVQNTVANLTSTPADWPVKGQWSAVIPWVPHIPVSAAVLPDGRLLTFSSNERTSFPDGPQFTYAATWNPTTGAFAEINNPRHDMFCGGLALLEDGRLLVNGGNGMFGTTSFSSLFDWRTNEWSPAQAMPEGRWYNTSVALPNGEVLTAGGNGGGNGAGTIDQWRDLSGWRRMSGINWASIVKAPVPNSNEPNWHPFLLVAPDGRVAHFGPHHDLNWLSPVGTGSITPAGSSLPGTHYPKQAAWAMYDIGKVLVAGGLQAIDNTSVVKDSYTVDLTTNTPVVASTAAMTHARAFSNSVILPNGEVMVVGGTNVGAFGSDAGTIYTPEIWNPVTRQWRTVADAAVPRNYHSLALLLPDGRVWSAGGGLYADSNIDHQDAQIYTPAPLFNANGSAATRPQITAAPDRIGPGSVFNVNATAGVQYFSFIRMSSLTHSVSTDLRHFRFPHTVTPAGQYVLTAPASANVITPGYWMLFAVNASGAWSPSRIVQVTNATLPVVTNPGTQDVVQAGAVVLPISASTTSGTLSYSASGLPAGLAINAFTGVISGGVNAAPGTYRSIVTVTAAGQSASVTFNWSVTIPVLGTGQIVREWWTGIEGATLAELREHPSYPGTPSGRDMITTFDTPRNWGDKTAQRVRGFLKVPTTGQYRFFITSDDQSALFLSTDDNPANAVQIATVPDWTPPQTWNWYPEQTSVLIRLDAGTRYYIEAIVKERTSDDHLSVGWQKPGDTAVSIIPGINLMPYLPAQNPSIHWNLDESFWSGNLNEVRASEQGIFRYAGGAVGGASTRDENPALSGNPGTGRSALFNGINQAVVVPYNANLNPNDLTIAAWVRLDGTIGVERCILSSRELSGIERGYGLWITAAGQWQFRTGSATSALTSGSSVVRGQWTHVAATFDTTNPTTRAGLRKLYVNGILVAEDASTYNVNASQPLTIAVASGSTGFFAGALDEISLHHSPLSLADIQDLRDLRHVISFENSRPQLTNPGPQTSTLNGIVALPLTALDFENNPLAFSATGLPPGLKISPTTGIISGAATRSGGFNVAISVTDGYTTPAIVYFSWTVGSTLTLQPIAASPQPSGAAQTFTAQALNGLNPRFRWNFGDGTPETAWSASLTTTHTYASPGRYLVTLHATDDSGIVVTSTFYQSVHAVLTAKKPVSSSSIAYQSPATGNARVWSVNPDNNSVSAFDVVTRARYAEIAVGTGPRALAFAPDGKLWITNIESATLTVVDPATRAITRTVALPRGSRPYGIVFDPAGTSAWVALEGLGRILSLNPTTGVQTGAIEAGGPVRHLSISADSARIYASRFITPRVTGENTATPVLTGAGGQVVVISASSLSVERTILLNPSTAADTETSARGLPNYLGAAAISPDGLSAWVPSKQDNIQRGVFRDGRPLNHETTVRAIASRIDLTAQAEHQASRIDIDNAGMPSAAAYDPWGIYLFIALEASREVAVLDAWTRQEILRFPTGRAPQGLVLSPDGFTLYVQNFMDRTVSIHDVSAIIRGGTTAPTMLSTLSTITTEALTSQVLQGKRLFYDAKDPRLALQEYMSCASCHNDAGHDGRVWDLTGFGEGLRNTITLKGHANNGSLHWSGNFDEVQDFEGQIRNLSGGTGLITGTPNAPMGASNAGRSADLDALAAYVKSLTTHGSSPNRGATGALSADAAAGEKIFRTQNCASCHSGVNFSSSALDVFANVGTITAATGRRLGVALTGLDVPTLRGVWATAPYLHDGSAATLSDAIKAHQGVTLSTADLAKVAAYVASLDDEPASAPLPFTLALTAPATTASGAFTVTATFNSAASGFDLSDVIVTNAAKSGFSGSGTTFTFVVTPTASGLVTVSVPADAATDSTTLGNSASNILSISYAPPVAASGVTADYYTGKNFEQHILNRVDPNIDFTWAASPGAGVPADGFSVRWQGTIVPTASGYFDFVTRTDDGVRLWLNGALVIDNWTDHGETWDSATIVLQAGVPVTVKMEYYENTGGAVARLFWDGPGAPFVAVPASAFIPQQAPAANGLTLRNSLPTELAATPSISAIQSNTIATTAVVNTTTTDLQIVSRDHTAVDAVLIRPVGQGTLTLESTADLINWTRIPIIPVLANLGGGMERVTWPDLQNVSGISLACGIVRTRVIQSWGGSIMSQPVGWQQIAPRTGVQTCGINLTHAPVFTGAAAAASPIAVTLTQQAALAPALDASRQFYLEIVSGPQAGHRLDVQSITTTACEIATASPNTTIAPASVDWASSTVSLRAHVTLADVFNTSRFQASTEPTTADQVLFHNGTGYDTYWLFNDGAQRRWLLNGDTTFADRGATIIPPGTGLMLQITAAAPQPVIFTGTVRTNAFVALQPSGYSLFANPWPVNATPAAIGMTTSVFVGSNAVATADQIQLWAGDTNPTASDYTGFWLLQHSAQATPTWVSTIDAKLASQNNVLLLSAGRATFLKSRPIANRPTWTIPAP